MAFPKHSILQALSVLLLASVLVRCQAPLEPEEEALKEAVVAKAETDPFECPADCKCAVEGEVDCAGVDLTEFPGELSYTTRQLSLQVLKQTYTQRL